MLQLVSNEGFINQLFVLSEAWRHAFPIEGECHGGYLGVLSGLVVIEICVNCLKFKETITNYEAKFVGPIICADSYISIH